MRAALVACAAGLLALGACRTVREAQDEPAVIVNPTDESRATLRRTVREALSGAPVTLADDALTRSSTLIIEPAWPRDPTGRRLGGREYGLPERFFLVRSGERCILVHERDGRRVTLEKTTCSALQESAGGVPKQ